MSFNPNDHMIQLGKKEYLETKWRLVWFREEHPKGQIITELVSADPIIMRATIISDDGGLLATGHGSAATKSNAIWSGHEIEKAETAAIGRALAHAGYGTQFTDEDEDVVDSPVQKPTTPITTPTATGAKVELPNGANANGERRVGGKVGEWPSVIGQVSSQEAVTKLYAQYNHRKAMIDLLITHGVLHGALTPEAAIERITAYHAAGKTEDFVGGATEKVRRERALEAVKEKYGLSGLQEAV